MLALRDRQLDRNLIAVRTQGRHSDASAQDPGRASGGDAGKPRALRLARVVRDHELGNFAAEGLTARISERRLGSAIELHDPALGVGRDHRVGGLVEHRLDGRRV